MTERDSIFAKPLGDIEGFRFNQAVADVFPDMLRRSVPGYEAIITQSALLASRHVQPNTHLYDLGSSLGATSISMREALAKRPGEQVAGCHIHAIDNAPAMISASRIAIDKSADLLQAAFTHTSADSDQSSALALTPIITHVADLEDFPLENASVVAMNFTLQFVAPEHRRALMDKIARAIVPGGVLILSEKVRFEDTTLNDMHIDMYHDFKHANGYSRLEISQKRTALENVLVPDTLEIHKTRLRDAGFARSTVWFQCFNFASLIALKS